MLESINACPFNTFFAGFIIDLWNILDPQY